MVRMWDGETGEPVGVLAHPGAIPILAYGPNSEWLVTGNRGDRIIRLWDTGTATIRREIQGLEGDFESVVVSPDGTRLAVSSTDGRKSTFQVLELESVQTVSFMDGRALAYSPDGRWLSVLASDWRTILLLDTRKLEPVSRHDGHKALVLGGVFSADSHHFATYGRDRTVRLWHFPSGECKVLRGRTDDVLAAGFHPDGTRLATAGRDCAIWIWDRASGEDVARLSGHTSRVTSLAFGQTDDALTSASGDATIRLWGVRSRSEPSKMEG